MPTDFHYVPLPPDPLSGPDFVEQTERAINELGGEIDSLVGEIGNATELAENAQRTANNALEQAQAANDNANEAAAAAANAQTAAEQASMDAANAQADADDALNIASEANTKVNEAVSDVSFSIDATQSAVTASVKLINGDESERQIPLANPDIITDDPNYLGLFANETVLNALPQMTLPNPMYIGVFANAGAIESFANPIEGLVADNTETQTEWEYTTSWADTGNPFDTTPHTITGDYGPIPLAGNFADNEDTVTEWVYTTSWADTGNPIGTTSHQTTTPGNDGMMPRQVFQEIDDLWDSLLGLTSFRQIDSDDYTLVADNTGVNPWSIADAQSGLSAATEEGQIGLTLYNGTSILVFQADSSLAWAQVATSTTKNGILFRELNPSSVVMWIGGTWEKLDFDVDLSAYASLDSPMFIGTPGAPTPPSGDSSTRIATTEFVRNAIGLVDVSIDYEQPIFVDETKIITITNYNSLSEYIVQADTGTVSISDNEITFTAPNTPGNVNMTVTKDGIPSLFVLAVSDSGVRTPVNVSPPNGSLDQNETLTLSASEFSYGGSEDTHASSDWQLSADADFNTIIQSSMSDTDNLTSWDITGLSANQTYYWRVRYTGANNGTSLWSAGTSFSTSAPSGSGVPTGAVFWFAANTPPEGFLVANGSALSRDTYSALFAVIGITFGAGNGSTTFQLPDLRGEFIRGWDSGRGVDAGRAFGSAQVSGNLSHTHSASGSAASAGAHTHLTDAGGSTGIFSPDGYMTAINGTHGTAASAGSHTHTCTVTVTAAGSTESRPRNIALLPCIKY